MTAQTDRRRLGLALALLAAAQFVVVLDASIVNVALPSIGRDLGFDQGDLSWVVNAYVLVFGGFLLLGGRLADLLGRRRIFIVGLVVFGLASLAGGLATSPGMLIAARAVQGLGGALLSPAALSMLTVLFAEGAARNKALGVWGAVAGSGGAAGVLLGGLLTEYAGWEWVLFVNTPITIGAALLATRLLPESRTDGPRRFDVAGAVTVTAGLSLLVYTLVDANNAGWLSGQTLGLTAVALGLLATFVVIELRSAAPLIDFSIFRMRTLTATNVVALLVAAALFSMFFFISLYMQQVLGYDALKAGLAYLPLAGGIIVSAGMASQLVTRIGFKPVFVSGLVLTAIGLASGLINTSQQVGGALGLAILVSVATSKTDSVMSAAGGAPSALPGALTEGFRAAFTVGIGFAVLGAILAAVLISSQASREHAAAARAGELEPAPAAA